MKLRLVINALFHNRVVFMVAGSHQIWTGRSTAQLVRVTGNRHCSASYWPKKYRLGLGFFPVYSAMNILG